MQISKFLNFDLVIGVLQILLGGYLSWRAFIVSLTDLPTEEKSRHLRTFGLCLLAVVALSVTQMYRNVVFNDKISDLQKDIAAKSDEAFMANVGLNLEPLSGRALGVDYKTQNVSLTGTAYDENAAAKIYLADTSLEGIDGSDGTPMYGVSVAEQDLHFSEFLHEISKVKGTVTNITFSPNESAYNTTFGPLLDQPLIASIVTGKKAVLLILLYKWKDSG